MSLGQEAGQLYEAARHTGHRIDSTPWLELPPGAQEPWIAVAIQARRIHATAPELREVLRGHDHLSIRCAISKSLTELVTSIEAGSPRLPAEGHGFWSITDWEIWSNEVAALMPGDWDGDESQEDIIQRFVAYASRHLTTCPHEYAIGRNLVFPPEG